MPFNPTDKDSFTKGFTNNRAFDKIAFREGRLVFGPTTIVEARVKQNLTVNGKLEAPIVGFDNLTITSGGTLTAEQTLIDQLLVNSNSAIAITTLTGPQIADAFKSGLKHAKLYKSQLEKKHAKKTKN